MCYITRMVALVSSSTGNYNDWPVEGIARDDATNVLDVATKQCNFYAMQYLKEIACEELPAIVTWKG